MKHAILFLALAASGCTSVPLSDNEMNTSSLADGSGGSAEQGCRQTPDNSDPPLRCGTTVTADAGDPGDLTIGAEQYDNVWVFEHAPAAGPDALYTGTVSIVDGCLFVGDAIVVWHASRQSDPQALIKAVQAGEDLTVALGGAGIGEDSMAEGDPRPIPTFISERCPTTSVWFANADAMRYVDPIES